MSQIKCEKCKSKFDPKQTSGLDPEIYAGSVSQVCPFCGHNNATSSASSQSSSADQVPHSPVPTQPVAQAPSNTQAVYKQGIPFDVDRKNRFWGSYFETLKLLLLQPIEFFKNYRPFEDLSGLLLFAGMNFLINAVFSIFFQSLIFFIVFQFFPQSQIPAEARPFINLFGGFWLIAIFIGLFLGPLLGILVTFIYSGLHHLMLITVGGSKKTFIATANVHFLFSFIQVVSLPVVFISFIPFLGTLIAFALMIGMLLYLVFYFVIGMAEVHNISVGLALLSVFILIFICCCLCFLPIAFLGEMFEQFLKNGFLTA